MRKRKALKNQGLEFRKVMDSLGETVRKLRIKDS